MARTYTTDKGTQVMLGLLLSQYKDSPLLIEYISAFTDEMNELYENIERVYYGRMFEDAEGAQLDIIGRIVDQNRNVNIAKIFFGFDTALGAKGFGDGVNSSVGGVFRAAEDQGFNTTPMDDAVYKRALSARFLMLNEQTPNINLVYKVITTLLDRVPSTFQLTEIASNSVQLTLAAADVTGDETVLIQYMSTWFIKAGCQFNIVTV